MSDIRLTICLPDNLRATIRPEKGDRIAEWVRTILNDNSFSANLEEYRLLKNNTNQVSPQATFFQEDFVNGDELHINKQPAVAGVGQEMEDIPEVIEGRSFHQLGILVLDGSESMGEAGNGGITLSEWVNRAVREFLGFFKNSSQVSNFSIAVITFDHHAKVHTPVTELAVIDDYADYNPLPEHGGGTYIGAGLLEAEKLANEFLGLPEASSIPHDVRIIVMSDGICQIPGNTKDIADRIKSNNQITICSSLFTSPASVGSAGLDEAKTILSDIASSPGLYKTSYKEADIRQFFINSMSAKRKYGDEKK